MGLSYVIEYLLTLERPGGGHLLYGGGSQLLIPIFPPNTSITLTSGPLGGDYAYIPFKLALGPAMVPAAFYAWAQQWGSKWYDATLASWVVETEIDAYAVVTRAEPSIAQITNISPLNQYYEGYTFFLTIASEDDFNLVLEALKRLSTSARLEKLGREAVELLTIITGRAPAPQPPIEEGS